MSTLIDGQSDLDSVSIQLPEFNNTIKNWASYSLHEAFLQPTASWSFTISNEDPIYNDILIPGTVVQFLINDTSIQCYAYIEKKIISSDNNGGTIITISGRDILGRVVNVGIDPKYRFSSQSTVKSIIAKCLLPFGIINIEDNDAANINILTGSNRQPDPDESEDLLAAFTSKLKPNFSEGVFAFLDKVMKKFGVYMWAKADGSGVVVAKPDFNQKPLYNLIHTKNISDNTNNVLHAELTIDFESQPSVIVAHGFGGNNDGDDDVKALRVVLVNEMAGLDQNNNILPGVQTILNTYKALGAHILPIRNYLTPYRKLISNNPVSGPVYLKDDESKTIDQLTYFTKRAMAKFQEKVFNYHCTVQGHTQKTIQNGQTVSTPWAVNTVAFVNDEVLGINEPMWIMERTFHKSLSGTTTDLKLIKLNTLELGKSPTSKKK